MDTKSRTELVELCKEKKIKGYSGKKKAELIALLVGDTIEHVTDETEAHHLSPLVKWSGGKSDELAEIVKYLPETFDTYLEPFVGGGALYFHLRPQKAVINDVHKDLIALYRSIGSGQADEIKHFMDDHPNEEETYYGVRDDMSVETDLDRAKQFYYLRKTCYRGMLRYNSSGKMNIPYGRYKSINYTDLTNPAYGELLSRATILNDTFDKVFDEYNSNNNFMFLDPPYDSVFTDYGYCSFGKEDHVRLAEHFKKTDIKCLMIIGKTDFIADLYKDYIVAEYPKKYRFKLHSGRVGDEINVMHLVIKNY